MKSPSIEDRILDFARKASGPADLLHVMIGIDIDMSDRSARNVYGCLRRLVDRKQLERIGKPGHFQFQVPTPKAARAVRPAETAAPASAPVAVVAPRLAVIAQVSKAKTPPAPRPEQESVARLVLAIVPQLPASMSRDDIARALRARNESVPPGTLSARLSSLAATGFLSREGSPQSYRYSLGKRSADDLKPAGRPESTPFSDTIFPKPASAARKAGRETIDEFLARGGVIQALPGFGHRAKEIDHSLQAQNERAAKASGLDRGRKRRPEILDEQEALEEEA